MRRFAAALVVAVALAACSSGPTADPTTAGPTTAGPATAGPATARPATARPATAVPATAVPSGVVAVTAKEFSFNPSALALPAGSITFSVRNVGTETHEFRLFKGDQLVGAVTPITPGLTKDLSVTLAAGDYTFICKLNGHDQLGMKGTLTVTGG